MILFATILLVPLLVAVGCYWLSTEITWRELLTQAGAQLLIAAVSAGICSYQDTADHETLNGRVTDKKQVYVSCSHSYRCNCYMVCTGSGKSRSCSQHCSTCYEHSNDWDWNVYTTVGTMEIDRVDRRGTNEPPRWTRARIGEPASTTASYKNYIKAAPDSLFRHQGLVEKFAGKLPAYPDEVYDYYRLDRLVLVNGAAAPDARFWNADLSELNADIGRGKQANAIVVLVRGLPRDYFYALEEAWLGGKKNDVVLVAGVDSERKPQWVEVMAWTTNPLVKVKLRDAVMALPVVERWNVAAAMRENIVAHYKRKPMADFEYLAASVTPSKTQWFVTLFIGLAAALGLSWLFHREDVFGEQGLAWRRKYQ